VLRFLLPESFRAALLSDFEATFGRSGLKNLCSYHEHEHDETWFQAGIKNETGIRLQERTGIDTELKMLGVDLYGKAL
jgi:hypothetical protein